MSIELAGLRFPKLHYRRPWIRVQCVGRKKLIERSGQPSIPGADCSIVEIV